MAHCIEGDLNKSWTRIRTVINAPRMIQEYECPECRETFATQAGIDRHVCDRMVRCAGCLEVMGRVDDFAEAKGPKLCVLCHDLKGLEWDEK